MRALVLGGNRDIGLHLVFELARQGHDAAVLNSHVEPLPDGARRLHGDRRLPGVLREVLEPHRDAFAIVFDNPAYRVTDLEPLVDVFAGLAAAPPRSTSPGMTMFWPNSSAKPR